MQRPYSLSFMQIHIITKTLLHKSEPSVNPILINYAINVYDQENNEEPRVWTMDL